MKDTLGAFLPGEAVRVAGAPEGVLAGLRFGAKDLFDVAGHVTGCGNPDWLRTHGPASRTAPAVQAILDAGAELAGKTITDELAFSLGGQNVHYGTPLNPAAPSRIPGGSSCGSASAVAGGAVDFALGTDTGGSVRVPAAFCGTFGIRPSHGAVPLDGVMPMAPSFDTVGWFARDSKILARVGDVLLPADRPPAVPGGLRIVEDAFDLADPPVETVLRSAAARIAGVLEVRSLRLADAIPSGPSDLMSWMACFRVLQGRETWKAHGSWIESVRPRFGADIEARFAWAREQTESAALAASPVREAIARRLGEILSDGSVLCLPSAPCVAPRLDADAETLGRFREKTLALTCVAGLARLPQVTLPAGRASAGEGDGPVGLSLLAANGADRALLALAARLEPLLGM